MGEQNILSLNDNIFCYKFLEINYTEDLAYISNTSIYPRHAEFPNIPTELETSEEGGVPFAVHRAMIPYGPMGFTAEGVWEKAMGENPSMDLETLEQFLLTIIGSEDRFFAWVF